MTSDQLSDIYTLHMMALVAKSLSKMHSKYPDMLPEELLMIAMAGFLAEEEDHPMGAGRQELLEAAMDHMKSVYGNEIVLLDIEAWRNLENLSTSIRNLASKGQ